MLAAEELRKLFEYNVETGIFKWKLRHNGRIRADRIAGSLNGHGYIHISINKKIYKAHRLAWLYVHGRWPEYQLDHINGIRTDNQIANLREATNIENMCNSGKKRNNTSGYKGVNFHKNSNSWRARININGKEKSLGYYSTAEDASAAYQKAALTYHGDFANF